MKICKYCGTNNNDNATFCRNCGKKIRKRAYKYYISIIVLLFIGVFLLLFFLNTNYYINPETYRIEVNAEGGEYRIPIETNIPYNEWDAICEDEWISVDRENNAIILSCKSNEEDCKATNYKRTGSITLVYGKKITEKVKVVQKENTNTPRGAIYEIVAIKGSSGIELYINFNVRYVKGGTGICCATVFYMDGTPLVTEDMPDGVYKMEPFELIDERASFKNFQVEIPYDDIELHKGEKINIHIEISDFNINEPCVHVCSDSIIVEITDNDINKND